MKGEGFRAFDIKSIVSLYEQNGEVLGEVTFEDNTALHIAAREGYREIVQWIVDNAKAMCVARNRDRNTPLHEAAKGGNAGVVRNLLDHNMKSASLLNKYGETALLIAIMYDHVDAAKLLVEATSLCLLIRPSLKRQTCLGVAAYRGHIDVFNTIRRRWLTQNRYPLSIFYPKYDENFLHLVVHGGHLDAVRTIVRSTDWEEIWLPSMTKFDNCGRCPIHIAVITGRWDIIQQFLSSSPGCLEIRSADGKTPLHFGVEYNQKAVVAKLLSNKIPEQIARMVSYDHEISGNTALHLATINKVDPEVLENLLKLSVLEMNIMNDKVDVNAMNDQGETPLDIALDDASQDQPNCFQIIKILKDAGARKSFIQPSKLSPRRSFQIYRRQEDKESKLMNVDTLVASLIVTVTFSAIFQNPAVGVEDDKNSTKKVSDTLFQEFLFFNTFAFFTSLPVVVSWIFRQRLTADTSLIANVPVLFLGVSVVSTGLAFYIATILNTLARSATVLQTSNRQDDYYYRGLFYMESFVACYAPLIVCAVYLIMLYRKSNYKLIADQGSTYWKRVNPVMLLASFLLFVYVWGIKLTFIKSIL